MFPCVVSFVFPFVVFVLCYVCSVCFMLLLFVCIFVYVVSVFLCFVLLLFLFLSCFVSLCVSYLCFAVRVLYRDLFCSGPPSTPPIGLGRVLHTQPLLDTSTSHNKKMSSAQRQV